MLGIAILLGFHLLGLTVQETLHLPLPGNVIGMILFTASLFLKLIKLEWVEDTAQFLLKHLALFFVPLIVGTMVLFPVLGRNVASIAAGLLGSTLFTLAITGWAASLGARKGGQEREH